MGNEEKSKHTYQYSRETPAWIQEEDAEQGRPGGYRPSSEKRQKEIDDLMITRGVVWLIGGYQRYVRGYLGRCCRYEPSCSEYARQAVQKYGLARGSWRALKRIFSCHPFSGKHGYDPLI